MQTIVTTQLNDFETGRNNDPESILRQSASSSVEALDQSLASPEMIPVQELAEGISSVVDDAVMEALGRALGYTPEQINSLREGKEGLKSEIKGIAANAKLEG